MNKTNYNILKEMQKSEYVTFLKNALGFYHFLNNRGMRLAGGVNSKQKEGEYYESC